jgi:hypothetical protein
MADAPRRIARGSIVIFVVYVGAAIVVVLLLPTISQITGVSVKAASLAAAGIFLAISLISTIVRRNRSRGAQPRR